MAVRPTTPAKTQLREPEIEWNYAPRIEPGKYRARSVSSTVYQDRGFKRWVCLVLFDILDDSLVDVRARVGWFLNLGSGTAPRSGRRSNYWSAWVKANGSPPNRRDRLSPRVFQGRFATVLIEDTRQNHRTRIMSEDERYSVVRDVLCWETGRTSAHENGFNKSLKSSIKEGTL